MAPFSENQTASDIEELTRKDGPIRNAWIKMRDSIYKVQESYYNTNPSVLLRGSKPDHPICTQLRRRAPETPATPAPRSRTPHWRIVSAEEWKSEFPDPKVDESK